MARETKVGLLVGLGFIVCFAVILENRGRQDRVAPVLPHELLANARLELVPSPAEVEERVRRSIAPPQSAAQRAEPTEARVTTVAYTPQGNRIVADGANPAAAGMAPSTSQVERDSAPSTDDAGGFALQVFKGVYVDDDAKTDTTADDVDADDIREPASNREPEGETERDARVAFARHFTSANVLAATQAAKSDDGARTDASIDAATAKSTLVSSGRSHTVVQGDSLSRIAEEYYGSRARQIIDELYKANRDTMKSPDALVVGQRLVLPAIHDQQFVSAAAKRSQTAAPADVDPTPKAASQTTVAKPTTANAANNVSTPPAEKRGETKGRYYQVQPGDRYATIAREELGDASRWKEIAELNRDIFPDPQRIRYGVRIRLPKDASLAAGSQS